MKTWRVIIARVIAISGGKIEAQPEVTIFYTPELISTIVEKGRPFPEKAFGLKKKFDPAVAA